MVKGIDEEIFSDITTCAIRRQLVSYAQQQCELYSRGNAGLGSNVRCRDRAVDVGQALLP